MPNSDMIAAELDRPKPADQTEIRMLSPSGILGYGFPEHCLDAGMRQQPHLLAVDGGSSDPGPHYLGSGDAFVSRLSMRRDIRLMLHAAIKAGIPLAVGTAGGAGGRPHLAMLAQMVRDIAHEDGLHFTMATIDSEQDKSFVKRRLAEGRIRALGRMPALNEATIDGAERIVALMGPEPYMAALDQGAQVILGGRTTDPAPFAAMAMRAGLPPAPSWYAGKMLECGAAPATPKGPDCLLARVRADSVEVEPTGTERRCTTMSVASHALHESASPIRHVEPGGILDTSGCQFDQSSDKSVRVSGMRWTKADTYTVKLEAAELVGYRVMTVCATRDPRLIGQIASYLAIVREHVRVKALDVGVAPAEYVLTIRSYGHDGVMSTREPLQNEVSHELGFVIDVVAMDPEKAAAVLSIARTNMLHNHFAGRQCTEGNMAIPFSPSDIKVGPVYRFSMAHVMELNDPCEIFTPVLEAV